MSDEQTSTIDEIWPDFVELAKPGVTVRLENKNTAALYRFVLVLQDKTIICKAVERPLIHGCEVGGILTVIRPTSDGSCAMSVKVVAIGDKAEIVAIMPIGKPQRIQRRVFPRIRTDGGIQVRLQFDNQVNRYKGLKIYDEYRQLITSA